MLTDEDREEIRAMILEENKKLFSSPVSPLDTDFTSGIYSGPSWTDAVGCETIGITISEGK